MLGLAWFMENRYGWHGVFIGTVIGSAAIIALFAIAGYFFRRHFNWVATNLHVLLWIFAILQLLLIVLTIFQSH